MSFWQFFEWHLACELIGWGVLLGGRLLVHLMKHPE